MCNSLGPHKVELIIRNVKFEGNLYDMKKSSIELIRKATFLGNHKAVICLDMVDDLVQSYKNVGCNMSIKVYFIHGC